MSTITLYVKLKGDDDVKAIPATDAVEEIVSLIVREGDKVVARFTLDRIEHWYSESLPQ
ncbi:hypothetical protein P5W99_36560 [Paraburkholderia sp. A3BS-1L]|uniref:hypothetical protein n=1 Tax=Paraburkholderia sp. A3BS-1L TaxID=3028375 RepID=UPI003DA7F65F